MSRTQSKEVCGIVLASGWSRRFGDSDKRLARLGAQTVIERTVDAYVGALSRIVLVTRPDDESIRRLVWSPAVHHVVNSYAEQGQSASLRLGVQCVVDAEVKAALIGVGDQPLLRTETLRSLIEAWSVHQVPTVAPTYDGQRGNPVLFSADLFPELLKVTGDIGGREILQRYPPCQVAIEPSWTGMDIDTPDDLSRAARYLNAEGELGFQGENEWGM